MHQHRGGGRAGATESWAASTAIASLDRATAAAHALREREPWPDTPGNVSGYAKRHPGVGCLFVNVCPAASYSPTPSPVQYHRR